jgi:hypothetical protein
VCQTSIKATEPLSRLIRRPARAQVAEAFEQAGTLRQLAMKAPAPTATKPGRYWVTVRGRNSVSSTLDDLPEKTTCGSMYVRTAEQQQPLQPCWIMMVAVDIQF